MKHWIVRHRFVVEMTVQAEEEASALAVAQAVETAALPDVARLAGLMAPVKVIDGGRSAIRFRGKGEVVIRKVTPLPGDAAVIEHD
jgi:hypothetical protein